MRYILGFFNFWRNFLIGGDWVIAMTVAWSLDFLFQLTQGEMNPWYLLPLIGLFVIGFSVQKAAFPTQHSQTTKKYPLIIVRQLWFPIVIVLVLPIIIFHLKTNNVSTSELWIPASIYLIIATLVALCLSWLYKIYPFGTSLFALLVTRLLVAGKVQSGIQNFAVNNQQSVLINTLSIVIAVLIILWQAPDITWWNDLIKRIFAVE